MDLSDATAVITSAKVRDEGSLERFLRGRFPEGTEVEIQATATVCEEIIHSIPTLLDRAWNVAGDRQAESVVEPILEQATRYLLSPVDVLPEMTLGLAGLLDDAYLVLRLLRHLDGGEEPLLDWNLDERIDLLQRVLGPNLVSDLNAHVDGYVEQAESDFAEAWASFSAEA